MDPFEYFRVSSWHKPAYFSSWQRSQNIGIASNYDYDAVVIGNSMTENFSTNQINKRLGWKSVNLAMSGTYAYEQRRLLELAIRTGKVKNVLWVVQWDAFAHPADFVRKDMAYLEGLYSGSPVALLQHYLLNTKMLKLSIKVFGNHKTMDNAWNWGGHYKFGCAPVMESYADTSRDLVMGNALSSLEMLTDEHSLAVSVQKNLFDVAKQNPGIKFTLIIPPYSKWSYKAQTKFGDALMRAVLNFRKSVAAQLGGLSNVTISDYQSDPRIILDADNYKDLTHFSPKISAMMIDEISGGITLPMQSQPEFLSRINLRGNCID